MTQHNEEPYKEQQPAEKEVLAFNLILVDIAKSNNTNLLEADIVTVKKNIYDKDLKFMAISYRWGELEEQVISTPDYTARITSFSPLDLTILCSCILHEPDLKDIPYLWIDAISVNQQDHARKKETIHRMSDVYKKATYILAVPDLHYRHLQNNPINHYYLELIHKYKKSIYKTILYGNNNKKDATATSEEKQETSLKPSLIFGPILKLKDLFNDSNNKKEEEIESAFLFLRNLVDDWSNRAWVISECNIARQKEKDTGKPLKYIFFSLFEYFNDDITYFFSYSFYDDDDDDQPTDTNLEYTKELRHDDYFFSNLKAKLKQRTHLDMILNSKACKNEDRFHAILPSWDKYKHWMQGEHDISTWILPDMISVRLKLYEIMDDVWDKAKLLYACSFSSHSILPSFATQCNSYYLYISEIDDPYNSHHSFSKRLLDYILYKNGNDENDEEYIDIKERASGLYKQNLLDIQLNQHNISLLVQANTYFMNKNTPKLNQSFLLQGFFNDEDDDKNNLKQIFIPFFITSISKYFNIIPLDTTGIYLLGDIKKNKWIRIKPYVYSPAQFIPCSDNYTFNIY